MATRNPMELYPITNPGDKARDFMAQSSSSYSKMGQNTSSTTEGPGKTAGGALMAGGSGAASGAMVGATVGSGAGAGAGGAAGAAAGGAATGSAGLWWGAAIGACVGLAAYYLG